MSETADYDKSATPTAHKATHQDGGSDQISIQGLLGVLSQEQLSSWLGVSGKPTAFSPTAHKTSHQKNGSDELDVTGLIGTGGASIKYGTFTHDSSSTGTQQITGLGFQPKVVLFFATIPAVAAVSIGMDDGTNPICLFSYGTTATANTASLSNVDSIQLCTSSGKIPYAHITTLGSDGFTLTWGKISTPTGTITVCYLAIQ